MGGGKRTYGTCGEGVTGKGESFWNVNKEYRKLKNGNIYVNEECILIKYIVNK